MTEFYCVLTTEGDFAWQEGEAAPEISGTIEFRGEWDGEASSIVKITGSVPARGIPFLGWPQVAI